MCYDVHRLLLSLSTCLLRAADSGRALVARAGQILVHSLDGTATSTSVTAVSASNSKLGFQSGSHFSTQPSADTAAVPQNLKLNPIPTLTLPPPGAPPDVACLALSQHFLVAGTASGGLWLFRCAERVPVAETRHAGGGIRCVWPQPAGVRRVLPLSGFQPLHSALFASPSLLLALPWGWLCLFCCVEFAPVAETQHAGGRVLRVWQQPAGGRRAALLWSESCG